jgi:hypothetical protein
MERSCCSEPCDEGSTKEREGRRLYIHPSGLIQLGIFSKVKINFISRIDMNAFVENYTGVCSTR